MSYQHRQQLAPPSSVKAEDELFGTGPAGLGLYTDAPSMPFSGAMSHDMIAPTTLAPPVSWQTRQPDFATSGVDAWTTGYHGGLQAMWNPPMTYAASDTLTTMSLPTSFDGPAYSDRSSVSSSNDATDFSRDGSEHPLGLKLEDSMDCYANFAGTPVSVVGQTGALRTTAGRFDGHHHHHHHHPSYRYPMAFDDGRVGSERPFGERRRPSRTLSYSAGNASALEDPARHKSASPKSRGPRRKMTTAANCKYSCPTCGKMTQTQYNLRQHLETHRSDRLKPHGCEHKDCNRAFVRRTDLLRHQESVSCENGIALVFCVCCCSFLLTEAPQVHHKSRAYACEMCDARFARKDTLQRYVYSAHLRQQL